MLVLKDNRERHGKNSDWLQAARQFIQQIKRATCMIAILIISVINVD